MEDLPPIPNDISQLTADWLTDTLSRFYPGTIVESVHIGTVIRGTATKARLLLAYNEVGHQHRLPPTMWFKGGLEAHSDNADMLAVYAGEAAFFQDLANTLNVNIPKAFVATLDPQSNRSMLLLEDLLARNATFGHATKPVTPEQAMKFVAFLAKLHAQYWQSPTLQEMAWLKGGGALLEGNVIDNVLSKENWDRCLSLPRGRFVTGDLNDFERMRGLTLEMLRHDAANAHCLVHGDAHLGNTFFTPDGEVGYLDWQTVMIGFWAHDVADFMTTSLTTEDRRRHERALIQHYADTLARDGVTLSLDDAWQEYRRHALYNFVWALCLPEWQPEEVCAPNAERACAAIQDLDTLNAW